MFQPVDGEYVEIMPAYGRDYKSKAAILADLFEDKDFILSTTRQYINLPQIWEHKFRVIVRYGKMMKTADVTAEIQKHFKSQKK